MTSETTDETTDKQQRCVVCNRKLVACPHPVEPLTCCNWCDPHLNTDAGDRERAVWLDYITLLTGSGVTHSAREAMFRQIRSLGYAEATEQANERAAEMVEAVISDARSVKKLYEPRVQEVVEALLGDVQRLAAAIRKPDAEEGQRENPSA